MGGRVTATSKSNFFRLEIALGYGRALLWYPLNLVGKLFSGSTSTYDRKNTIHCRVSDLQNLTPLTGLVLLLALGALELT